MDRRICLERLHPGAVNRVRSATASAGGKAAHVALALRALDADAMWVGLLGGTTGADCERGLREYGLNVIPVRTSCATRMNLEIIEESGPVTELLEPGGPITSEEASSLADVCRDLFGRQQSVVLAISGSLPLGMPAGFYARLADAAHARSHVVLVDTTSAALQQVLGSQPDLVKVNRSEAGAVVGRDLNDTADVLWAAQQLRAAGAQSVAISCGAEGLVALVRGEEEAVIARSAPLSTRSAVGCGDATLAGFAAAYSRKLSMADTLRLAVACGAANCLAEGPGRIEAAQVEALVDRVQITALDGADHYLPR
jgi:1-phosphofructokinase family hexose kinase